MIDLNNFSLRELQKECARAVIVIGGDNNTLSKFNKIGQHNSQAWYKAVIEFYIQTYGDLPSKVGPGSTIKTIL
jgi:hypothetical protein